MGDTFSVFKRKGKPKFHIEEPKHKREAVKVTAKRRAGAGERRKAEKKMRPKRTLYEDTINIDPTGSVDSAEYATASIESIRARKNRGKIAWGVGVAVLITALVAVLVFVGMMVFFRIESVSCQGVTMYDEEEIIAASGITVGEHLYKVNGGAIAEELRARFPYLKEIKVKADLPTGIVITVTEDEAAYFTDIGGRYYILSPQMRVLESLPATDASLEPFEGKLLQLDLPSVSRAVVGESVQYFSAVSEKYVGEVMTALTQCEQADGIVSIDLSSRFDISFSYERRITVLLGRDADIEAKLKFAFAIIDEFSEDATGTVSAETVEEGYAIVDDIGG